MTTAPRSRSRTGFGFEITWGWERESAARRTRLYHRRGGRRLAARRHRVAGCLPDDGHRAANQLPRGREPDAERPPAGRAREDHPASLLSGGADLDAGDVDRPERPT